MTTLLKCLACGEIVQMHDGRNVCRCHRSTARMDETVVELEGPARILIPADDMTTVDGVPWTALPESPVVIRRAEPLRRTA